MKLRLFTLSALAAGLLLGTAAQAQENEPVQPIPAAVVTDPARVELGKKLWFEPRLSRSGFISCNSCHNLSMGARTISAPLLGIAGRKARSTHRPSLTPA